MTAKNGTIVKYVIWLLTLSFLGGGIVTCIKWNRADIDRNTAGREVHSQTIPVIQSDIQHIREDVGYIRAKIDKM
jgi:hypothetical protein